MFPMLISIMETIYSSASEKEFYHQIEVALLKLNIYITFE